MCNIEGCSGFGKNCRYKEEHNFCHKCGETKGLAVDIPYDSMAVCKACHEISLTGAFFVPKTKLEEIHFFIWYNGIEEYGLEWYKKARDKLIKRYEILKKRETRKKKEKNSKLKATIDGWK